MNETELAKAAQKKARKARTRALKKARRSEEQARKTSLGGADVDDNSRGTHGPVSSPPESSRRDLTCGIDEERATKKRKKNADHILSVTLEGTSQQGHRSEDIRYSTSIADKKAARKAAKRAQKALESRSTDDMPQSQPIRSTRTNKIVSNDGSRVNGSPDTAIENQSASPNGPDSTTNNVEIHQEAQQAVGPFSSAEELSINADLNSSPRSRRVTAETITSTPLMTATNNAMHKKSETDTNHGAAFAQDDPLVPRARKAIQKFLRRDGMSINEFAVGVKDRPIMEHPFFKFGKPFFASMGRDDFGRLVRQVTSELQSSVVPLLNSCASSKSVPPSQHPLHKRQGRQKDDAKEPSGQDHRREHEHRQPSEDGREYRTGPLAEHEKTVIIDAVDAYCAEHDLSHGEFCNIVWDLPRPLPRDEKKQFYAEFFSLLPDRKSRTVRAWFKRAYLPYDRSPFTDEDDNEILRLHSIHGTDWKLISDKMGRFREDVRDRYRNFLATKSMAVGEWSPQENERFEDILKQYHNRSEMNWGVIAKQMGSRSRPQCRDRYLRMQGERTRNISKLRRELRNPMPSDSSSPAGKNESSKFKAKILPGDVLRIAKLMKANSVTSIEEALERELFHRHDYSSIFGDDNIHIKMKLELDHTGTGRFVTKLARLIQKYEAKDQSELLSSIVED